MGSPLGPLFADIFMSELEKKLEANNQMPSYYKRYVDDTFVIAKSQHESEEFLSVLNSIHEALTFTMETANNGTLPFLGMTIVKHENSLSTQVYRKATNTGLLLHHQSHVYYKYKHSLLHTMIDRAYRLSSTWKAFSDECNTIKKIFTQLKYPLDLIDRKIKDFLHKKFTPENNIHPPTETPTRLLLPYKDDKSSLFVRRRLRSINTLTSINIQPVFLSRKVSSLVSKSESKPNLINSASVIYKFQCKQCDANYIGYTTRHLFERVTEHRYSIVGKHLRDAHLTSPFSLSLEHFTVLKSCPSKFDLLIYEMLYIRDLKPSLNTQSDSIQAKFLT